MDAAWLGRRREEADNEKSQGDQGHGPEPAADVLRALQHLPGDRIQGLVVFPGLLPRQQPRQLQITGCQEVEGTVPIGGPASPQEGLGQVQVGPVGVQELRADVRGAARAALTLAAATSRPRAPARARTRT